MVDIPYSSDYSNRRVLIIHESVEFSDWLRTIDRTHRIRIVARLTRVGGGNFGDHKSVGGGVNEMRIDVGPGYRVYYGRRGRRS
jgi:putative addiction module killer protein